MQKARLVGLGGFGSKLAEYVSVNSDNIWTAYIDTDPKHVDRSPLVDKLLVSFSDGMSLSERDMDAMTSLVSKGGPDIIFLACGLGGRTGTTLAPYICKIAHGMGIPCVCLVTSPFRQEGCSSWDVQFQRICLERSASRVLVFDNNLMVERYPDILVHEAFERINEVFLGAMNNIILGVPYQEYDFNTSMYLVLRRPYRKADPKASK